MVDDFFRKTKCDRCGGSLAEGRILSMYNEDVLCLKCKDAETRREDYEDAVKADHEEIRKGNFNFKGIGYKK